MITTLRNFLNTLDRFKLSSILNIVGLSVAFAAFMVIMMQVRHEYTFDRIYSKTDRIYRVEMSGDSINYTPLMSRPEVDMILSASPQIEAGTIYNPFSGEGYINVSQHDGTTVGFKEIFNAVYPGITDVFDFEMVEGSADALDEPNKVIIPQSLARKLFGTDYVVGRIITRYTIAGYNSDTVTFEVGGVYKDFPVNSSLKNDIKYRMPDSENKDHWGNSNYYAFITLHPSASPEDVARMINDKFKTIERPEWYIKFADGNDIIYRLTPIRELYYRTEMAGDYTPKGNRSTTNILLAVGLFVVVIAAINYINFSTSLVPMRIKGINTRKVLGSSVSTLRWGIIFEAIGICLIAYVLSLLWVYLFNLAGFSSMLITPADMTANLSIVFGTLALALVLGIISGAYPAFYITSFQPALVLKGSFGMSRSGLRMRIVLIGFQFVISIGLIIAAIFLQLQNAYIRNFDTGMDQEQVAIVFLNSEIAARHKNSLVDKLKTNPAIDDVAFSMMQFGDEDFCMSWGRDFNGRIIRFDCLPVSYNFPKMMGLEIVEGRDFEEGDDQRPGTLIFNQTGMKANDLEIGQKIDAVTSQAPIVGVVKDFNYMTLRSKIGAMALYEAGNDFWFPLSVAYVKIKGDPYRGAEYIRKTVNEIDPYFPVEINFHDQMFDRIYKKESKTTRQITLFSMLAIVISLVGIFGLVVFETQHRRKEIGVRKVHGATVGEILAMFNKSFVVLVIVSFVVAAPLAYIAIGEWLKGFQYRTPLYWWVFALALMIVVLITLFTVTVQAWRAATNNPVNSLKCE